MPVACPPISSSEERALDNPVDNRRSPRANVLLVGEIESGKARIPVRVSNLSPNGALVIARAIPNADARVVFHCNGLAVHGWVAWAKSPQAGIQFDELIQPEELLRTRSFHPPTVTRDTRQLDFRRPGFRGNQLTQEERELLEDWRASQGKSTDTAKIKPSL